MEFYISKFFNIQTIILNFIQYIFYIGYTLQTNFTIFPIQNPHPGPIPHSLYAIKWECFTNTSTVPGKSDFIQTSKRLFTVYVKSKLNLQVRIRQIYDDAPKNCAIFLLLKQIYLWLLYHLITCQWKERTDRITNVDAWTKYLCKLCIAEKHHKYKGNSLEQETLIQ